MGCIIYYKYNKAYKNKIAESFTIFNDILFIILCLIYFEIYLLPVDTVLEN